MTTQQRVSRMERHMFGDDQQTTATWKEIQRAFWAANPLHAHDDPSCAKDGTRIRAFLASLPRWKLRRYAKLFPKVIEGFKK